MDIHLFCKLMSLD